jgi:hypothetical protein
MSDGNGLALWSREGSGIKGRSEMKPDLYTKSFYGLELKTSSKVLKGSSLVSVTFILDRSSEL